MINTIELRDIAEQINEIDFGQVFKIVDGEVKVHICRTIGEHAPDVYHDPDGDVTIDDYPGDATWTALTGQTGQYSYSGAVMHPSEYVGTSIAEALYDYATEDPDTLFAMVTVTDPDDGDDIGWAVVYRTP